MELGIERFCKERQLRSSLQGKRVALLAHPASVVHDLTHSIDAIMQLPDIKLVAAFGPQHGMRGEKQDNMIESDDYLDPVHHIPVFSLYGKVRRPTPAMMDTFDVILVDLQDLGCRIYTFITTLLYFLEECSKTKKSLWVLDRPNPIGRPIEGSLLQAGWESFVGAAEIPMRHGLTLGELAKWYVQHFKLDVDLNVIEMRDYTMGQSPGYGWPLGELSWVNPSPNAPNLSMARCYPGSVLLEGTHLSEGRGTTRPLEGAGAPDLDMTRVLKTMESIAPEWLKGCRPRICYFEPTFHKHVGKLCQGIQFHVDHPEYQHFEFRPYRAFTLLFKAIRQIYPTYSLWRSFPYEYEHDRLAIDLINGSPILREWVDDTNAKAGDLEKVLRRDEALWEQARQKSLIYKK
jgi:uncharacterized protein YbbC (DUF1343 family)